MALEWYEDVDEMDRWVVAGGPEDWPRIETLSERPDVELSATTSTVSDIVLEDHRISFTTDAIGVPHVVKISYFPNWTAHGAEGPWRAAPSLMVVVPTENHVELIFQDTWAESGGQVLTLLGVIGLILGGLFAWTRTRRTPGGSASPSKSAES